MKNVVEMEEAADTHCHWIRVKELFPEKVFNIELELPENLPHPKSTTRMSAVTADAISEVYLKSRPLKARWKSVAKKGEVIWQKHVAKQP